MGLSDACSDFVSQMKIEPSSEKQLEAIDELRGAIRDYSLAPFSYGEELGMLAAACNEFVSGRSTSSNADPVQRIIFLADAVREQLDTPPGHILPAS